MGKPNFLWLGIHSEKVLEIMKRNEPEGLDVHYTHSKTDKEEHLALLKDAEYVSANGIKLTDEYIMAAPKLKLVQSWSAGTDGINKELLKERGIAFQNGVGFNAPAVAEMAVMLMLGVNRYVSYVDPAIRSGRWLKVEMREKCHSVYGKTVGLIGMGHIGKIVSRYVLGMDAEKVIYYDPFRLSEEEEAKLNVTFMPFEDVLKNADILSLHCPATKETEKMIGKSQLEMMKRDAILINTARGKLVDEPALVEALQNGTIRGAGLDTYDPEPPMADNPLFKLDNVVLMSHGGGAVIENVEPRVQHVYNCCLAFERGEDAPKKYIVVPRPGK